MRTCCGRFQCLAAPVGIVVMSGLAVTLVASQASRDVRITVLSTRSSMVTGGDALVRVDVPAGVGLQNVRVMLNNTDVTPAFRQDSAQANLTGFVKGLVTGSNTLSASAGTSDGMKLEVVNYPITGPVFSGPQERPFICETQNFKLRSGGTLGPPLDASCSVRTRVDYLYRSTAGGNLRPLADPKAPPADLAQTKTLLGATVPYIVRIETGTINRAIYQIAMLHNPVSEPAPDFITKPAGWNGRLIYTFGGGCPGGWYHQGASTGGVEDDVMLRQGYAVASASLNVFGNNCNDLLAAETMMMVREHFIEAYGQPLFTIGWGCSGGSYQAHQIGDNYPGLLDGIVVGCSFPDVGHASISVHSFGARLLYHYFQTTAGPWTIEQQVAVSGVPNYDSLSVHGAALTGPAPGASATRRSLRSFSMTPSRTPVARVARSTTTPSTSTDGIRSPGSRDGSSTTSVCSTGSAR